MSEYADHYARAGDVYRELGQIGESLHCPASRDYKGWYRWKSTSGNWDGQGRTWALGKEWVALRQDLDRTVYATTNYAAADWFLNAWWPFNWADGGGFDWKDDEQPTPGYGDLRAYTPFADIDLADDVKPQRPAGEIPQERIEEALELYIDAFAALAGGRGHVFALDSVGGAYVFAAPTATAPIADAFDREGRAAIFKDMMARLNDWLAGVREDVNDALPGIGDVFAPDLLNNKNRLYKAPLSVHSNLEGVVTPIDVGQPQYDYRPIDAVDDELLAATEEWAAEFTDDHTDAVAAVVATLWPDHSADAGSWEDALAARLEELMEVEADHRARQAGELSDAEVPEGIERTDDLDVLRAKIEAIDVQDVARQVSSEWNTAPGRDPPRFAPSWRVSESKTSCYADREKFFDLKEGAGGGPLKLIARARGIISDCSHTLRGDDYWLAVNELRKEGYDIPYFNGKDGKHPDGLRLYGEPDDDESSADRVARALLASDRDGYGAE